MALQAQSPSTLNSKFGIRAKHPRSHEDDDDSAVKRSKNELPHYSSNRAANLDDESPSLSGVDDEISPENENTTERRQITDVESTLPPVRTDQDAIDEYESSQAARLTDEDPSTTLDRLNNRIWVKGKSSIYVDAFNLALETVLEEESHLFDESERTVFNHWKNLSYDAQYLYVRLFLRKTSAWHRTNALGYRSDIANLDAAASELQEKHALPVTKSDLPAFPGDHSAGGQPIFEESFSFAENSDLIVSLAEASPLLKLDELKVLAKEARVHGKNKKELVNNLRRTSKSQVGLKAVLRRSDTEQSSRPHTSSLAEGNESLYDDESQEESSVDKNRDAHFVRKILEETGPCIRLSITPLRLFERVHLVFYRSTEWTEKSLTTIILARISKRNFPEYIVSRSASVFGTRTLLIEFEVSLRTQFTVDNILEFNGKPTSEGLQNIITISDEVYPRWRALITEELRKERDVYHSGEGAYLRRLSPAWVYTRIIHKATGVFAKLKMHKREHEVLCDLLEQRLFHHARRGAWYQRKALIEEHYMANLADREGRSDDAQIRHWKRIALKTCEDGMEDSLVHLIYHHDLQKRISKLERTCKIPKREQHDFSHVRLAAPSEVTVYGIRKRSDAEREASSTSREHSRDTKMSLRGTRTIWLDSIEGQGECTVEEMCLSHYRSLGWKGFHCEGRLLKTLFGYLFFDVLFLYVPNVFQTPFQICPLDLHTDGFYPCRMSEINHRLAEIENGIARELIQRVWNEQSERETCVIGLDWAYDINDLLEIAELFDGQALATICKVLVQDYGSRGGGIPDLFLWHPEQKEIKLSEVKSENDRLSDTQRLWIDVLTGAGVNVELCNAVAKEVIR